MITMDFTQDDLERGERARALMVTLGDLYGWTVVFDFRSTMDTPGLPEGTRIVTLCRNRRPVTGDVEADATRRHGVY